MPVHAARCLIQPMRDILRHTTCARTNAESADARGAEGRASASTSAKGANARRTGGRASASTSTKGAYARSAGGRASASSSAKGANARSAGARASASTSAKGARGHEHPQCVPAPAPKEQMQGVRGREHLPASAHQGQMQGVRGREHYSHQHIRSRHVDASRPGGARVSNAWCRSRPVTSHMTFHMTHMKHIFAGRPPPCPRRFACQCQGVRVSVLIVNKLPSLSLSFFLSLSFSLSLSLSLSLKRRCTYSRPSVIYLIVNKFLSLSLSLSLSLKHTHTHTSQRFPLPFARAGRWLCQQDRPRQHIPAGGVASAPAVVPKMVRRSECVLYRMCSL